LFIVEFCGFYVGQVITTVLEMPSGFNVTTRNVTRTHKVHLIQTQVKSVHCRVGHRFVFQNLALSIGV